MNRNERPVMNRDERPVMNRDECPVMNRNERPVMRRCLRYVTSIHSGGNVGVNMGLRNWDFFAKFVG